MGLRKGMKLETWWTRSEILNSVRRVLPPEMLDWPALATRFGFDLTVLDNPNGIIPMRTMNEIFAHAAEVMETDSCFFDIFHEMPIGQYSLYDYLFVCAPTVRDGCLAWVRYMPMRSNAVSIQFTNTVDGGYLEWAQQPDAGDYRHVMYARLAWALKRVEVALNTPYAPVQAELAFPKPKGPSRFLKHYAHHLRFDAHRNAIHFTTEILDRKPAQNEKNLYAIIQKQAQQELTFCSRKASTASVIAEAIAERMRHGGGSLSEVATVLGMSGRSIQRALEEEGTSFRKLTEDIRKSAAIKYLKDTDLSIKEISYLLGFSEISTFSKAVKSWYGQTPSSLRKSFS